MLVVDASFLVAVFAEERHTDFARAALRARRDRPRAAPGLMLWEFANVLWKKRLRDEIEDRHFDQAIEFLAALDVEVVAEIGPAQAVALARLGTQAGLTAYDAAYLDLAFALSAALATTDRDLTKAAIAAGLTVHSPFA